jgi:hypothetical protein
VGISFDPCPTGYICLSCKQVWIQLSLIETLSPPMSTPVLSLKPKKRSIPHPPVASGKSEQIPLKLFPVSASLYQEWIPGTYHHCVRVYHSKGKLYYRYTCNVGHDVMFDLHIPGGNVRNAVAKRRAEQVRAWIREGFTPDQIAASIFQWRAKLK